MTTLLLLSLASVNSCMIASDCIFIYKIISGQVKCTELAALFPLQSPNYALRRTMPFYPEMPTGRHPERNPVFRLWHCYNELAPKLVNPQEFSLEINKVAALIKKLTPMNN